MKAIYFKSDLKQLYREPMMALLYLIPLIMAPLFLGLLTFAVPFGQQFITFDVTPYNKYVLTFVLLLVPGMLGIVMGFMLLDDKDGHIIELLSITPLGRSGYLILRLSFIAISTLIYSIYSYLIMGLYLIHLTTLIIVTLLLCVYGAIIGLIFIRLATDKVKGLTYAKGLNIMILFVMADLLNTPWITVLAGFFPTYWIYKIIETNGALFPVVMGLLVHGIWVWVVYGKFDFS